MDPIHPYLSSQFPFPFEFLHFAFLVECPGSNPGAKSLLQRNQRWIEYGFGRLIEDAPSLEQGDGDQATPSAIDDPPKAWLFPKWREGKNMYTFGNFKCDIILPSQAKVSRKHFGMFLTREGVWMIRNFSRFGTLVDGDIVGKATADGDVDRSCHALNPCGPNEICAGKFSFNLHLIPHKPSPSTSIDQSMSSLLDVSYLGLASTVGTSNSTTYPMEPSPETYYYLDHVPIPVEGPSKILKAVHKWTGLFYVAKLYHRSQRESAQLQYNMMSDILNKNNIVSFIEILKAKDSIKIITPYLNIDPLAAYRETTDLRLAFIVYRDITSALQSLEQSGIVHNDITEDTIFIRQSRHQDTAYLTGFSEFTRANSSSDDGFHHDLSCLTQVVKRMLPTIDGRPKCDPRFGLVISEALNKQLSAAQVNNRLKKIESDYGIFSFGTFYLTKQMTIKRLVDKNNVEVLRLLDFLRIVLFHPGRNQKSIVLVVRKVIRKERLVPLEGEIYCRLEDAANLMHVLQKDHSYLLFDLDPPTHKEACWYQTTHELSFSISWHISSRMVNVTQILNILGDALAEHCTTGIAPDVQEVRGSEVWEGIYVDQNSLDELLGRLNLMEKNFPMLEEDHSQHHVFRYNDSDHFITIADKEMLGLIFLKRDSTDVIWDGVTKTVGSAIKKCGEYGLSDAMMALQTHYPQEPDWTARFGDVQILRLFDEDDCPSEATISNSFPGSDDKFHFSADKRKGPSDVPVVPKCKSPSFQLDSETTTSAAETEKWVEKVTADIRPTRFRKESSDATSTSILSIYKD